MFKTLISTAIVATVSADGHAHHSIFDVQKEVAEAQDAVSKLNARISADSELTSIDAFSNTIDLLTPSLVRIEQLITDMKSAQSSVAPARKEVEKAAVEHGEKVGKMTEKLQKDADDKINERAAALNDMVKKKLDALIAVNDKLLNDNTKKIDTLKKQSASIVDALETSHHSNPKTPVFRWNVWHGYSNNYGWFQGNSNEPFGGIHPSEWVDGNQWSHNMNADLKYMRRLFNKEGYGDETGAMVCAQNNHMPHSTDDKRCGALFRIKNTRTSNVGMSINWSYSGWCGWGNRASTSVNRNNVWGGCCHAICNRNDNYNLKAGKTNTVIFIAGGDHPYGHWNYQRTTFLAFNSLKAPDGVEFVDDMDTATDTWAI